MEVDPVNRLVAAHLEAEWNTRLAALEQAIEERERNSKTRDTMVSAEQEQRLRELANDFGTVWNGSATGNADRKRLPALPIVWKMPDDASKSRPGAGSQAQLSRQPEQVVHLRQQAHVGRGVGPFEAPALVAVPAVDHPRRRGAGGSAASAGRVNSPWSSPEIGGPPARCPRVRCQTPSAPAYRSISPRRISSMSERA